MGPREVDTLTTFFPLRPVNHHGLCVQPSCPDPPGALVPFPLQWGQSLGWVPPQCPKHEPEQIGQTSQGLARLTLAVGLETVRKGRRGHKQEQIGRDAEHQIKEFALYRITLLVLYQVHSPFSWRVALLTPSLHLSVCSKHTSSEQLPAWDSPAPAPHPAPFFLRALITP